MRKKPRDARLLLVVTAAVLLFAGLALLSFFIVDGEARRSRIITEYEADRMASAIAESLRVQDDGQLTRLDPRVVGFGLYDQKGELVSGYGDAPTEIDASAPFASFSYDEKARRLFLTRALGMVPPPVDSEGRGRGRNQRLGQMGMGMMGRMGAQARGFLYLSLDVSDFYRRRALLRSASILLPLFVAGLAVAFLFLLASNLRYRKSAEQRETLVRLGESARTLAHEIRNPLGAIRIQTALARQRLGGESWPELDTIDEETQRLGSLSRRVGEFLKDPAGRPERIELRPFLDELASRSPHRPAFAADGAKATVLFDPELLRSSIENLLRNADESYESLPEAERVVELELSVIAPRGSGRIGGRGSGRAVIAVRDRGVGIPEAARDRVFDPFYTDKVQGSGIGLPLARRFVEAAKGSLELIPRQGGGTEARIVLPLAEES
jgi:signal transduction histidine kinase